MRPDIEPGKYFPDYELPDHTGEVRSLSEIQRNDPMILVLSRGGFCPKDRQQLLELAAFYPKINVAYTAIVTVTTDNFTGINELRKGVGANWPFLYDEKRMIQEDLNIQEYTDPENNPMIPYTFVLEPGLRIYSMYNGYWFWGRPSPEELRKDLRAVTQKIRPDYKIDTPLMRERWERDRKDYFWPYKKELKKEKAGFWRE